MLWYIPFLLNSVLDWIIFDEIISQIIYNDFLFIIFLNLYYCCLFISIYKNELFTINNFIIEIEIFIFLYKHGYDFVVPWDY